MTPSEKKASDGYKFIEWIHRNCKRIQMSFDEQEKGIIVLNGMFESAERRGFERAKRMASKTLQDYECHYLIENLKYEDSHDEA